MKLFIKFCFIALLFPIHGKAQELMPMNIEEYLSNCLDARRLISEKKCDELLLCAQRISLLDINELSDSVFISLQPNEEKCLDNHVVFTDSGLIVVAEAIINENSTKYNLHNINRGNAIYLAHRIIPANSIMKYQIDWADNTDLLVFQEKTGIIDVSVRDENGDLIDNDILYSLYSENGWTFLKFYAGDMLNPIVIEVTNREDEDICCAFAINGQ